MTLSYLPQTVGEGGGSETKDKIQPQTVLLWDRKAEGGFPGEFSIRMSQFTPSHRVKFILRSDRSVCRNQGP